MHASYLRDDFCFFVDNATAHRKRMIAMNISNMPMIATATYSKTEMSAPLLAIVDHKPTSTSIPPQRNMVAQMMSSLLNLRALSKIRFIPQSLLEIICFLILITFSTGLHTWSVCLCVMCESWGKEREWVIEKERRKMKEKKKIKF